MRGRTVAIVLLLFTVVVGVAFVVVGATRSPAQPSGIAPPFTLTPNVQTNDSRAREFALLPQPRGLVERLYAELDAIHQAGLCAQYPWAGTYWHGQLDGIVQSVVIAPSGFVAYTIGCTGIQDWSTGRLLGADADGVRLVQMSGENYGWRIDRNYRVYRLGPSVSLVPVGWFGQSNIQSDWLRRSACPTCDAPFTTKVVRHIADEDYFAKKTPRSKFHDTFRWVSIDRGQADGFLRGLKLYALSPQAKVPQITVATGRFGEACAMFTFGDEDPGGPSPGDEYSTRPPEAMRTGQSGPQPAK